jgi:hypothetical protein
MQANFKAFQDRAGIYALDASGQFEGAYNTLVSSDALAKLDMLCPTIEVDSPVYRFAGIKGVPELRPFDGEMQYGGVDQWTQTVYSNEYGMGVAIRYIDWKADQKNMDKFMGAVPAFLATKAVKQRFELLAALVEGNPVWQPDGKAIYADDHDFGDNNISVTVSAPTAPTTQDWQTVIDAVITQFGTFTDDQGQNLTEDLQMENMLMLAPSKYSASLRRIKAETTIPVVYGTNTAAAAKDNIDQGTFNALCSPRLTQTNNVVYVVLGNPGYQMIGTNAGSGPAFVTVEFEPYSMTTNNPGSDSFMDQRLLKTNLYGIRGVSCVAAQRTIKVTLE